MLTELRIRNLGVVEDVSLLLGPAMSVLTGETGAGKTMIIEALNLVTGAKADPSVVRAGCDEAVIEARFVVGNEETILSRVVPRQGRSRGYVDGQMSSSNVLAGKGAELLEVHAQHASISLFSPAEQRRALDLFGEIDTTKLTAARAEVARISKEISSLASDDAARLREADLLRYQLDELTKAELTDPLEMEKLKSEEEQLASAGERREAARLAHRSLSGDAGAVEAVSAALQVFEKQDGFDELADRLRNTLSELQDVALEADRLEDSVVDDPKRLAAVQERRFGLRNIEKKYGPAIGDAIAFREDAARRLDTIDNRDENRKALEESLAGARVQLTKEADRVFRERSKSAPLLAGEVQSRLRTLALPNAEFLVDVAGEAGDDTAFRLTTNPGMAPAPLAKAASGGELSRTMLALRLSLTGKHEIEVGPATFVFDEVDAGVGGEAAVAVAHALAGLAGAGHVQVLVVTHLAQVAAAAQSQFLVHKTSDKSSTTATLQLLDDEQREVEITRMLSGRPDSESGRAHARELLGHSTKKTARR